MWRGALLQYEEMHKAGGFVGDDEYHIISEFVKGVKSVDIACGEGYIEKKVPDTIGVDFSREALSNAKNNGAKYLVRATAEYLPFKNDVFKISISLGSLEHFKNPALALIEMGRISKIQILTVHAELPFPLSIIRKILSKILLTEVQPIEHRFKRRELINLLKKSELKIVFWGYHKYVNLHYLWQNRKFLEHLAKLFRIPGQINVPSHYFVITRIIEKKGS